MSLFPRKRLVQYDDRAELFSGDVSKYNALMDLDHDGIIRFDETIYFGDDYNDECVADRSCHFVAMADTPGRIKEKAWRIAPPDGIAAVLRELYDEQFGTLAKE